MQKVAKSSIFIRDSNMFVAGFKVALELYITVFLSILFLATLYRAGGTQREDPLGGPKEPKQKALFKLGCKKQGEDV